MEYAVIEILSRQYKVKIGEPFEVDYLGNIKELSAYKVLLMFEGKKLLIGRPYLDKKLTIKVLEKKIGFKVRVSTYKAKANSRKTKGQKRAVSKVVIQP